MKNLTKYLKIIILILSISLLIYFIFNDKPNYFNKIKLPPIKYQLYNRTSINYLDTIVKIGVDELKINPKFIVLKSLKGNNNDINDGDFIILAYIIYENGQFLIKIGDMNRDEYINVISHELIHLEQIKNKKLLKYKDSLIWNGHRFTRDNMPTYYNRPWESEAIKRGDSLAIIIRKKLYKK